MTTLDAQLTDHRAMYRDELDFTPSQRTPPVAYTFDETERAMVPDDRPLVVNYLKPDEYSIPDSATQSTQVGMPMSGRMLRYLQGPTADTPWATSLMALRSECRRRHRHHRGPKHWRGSLCWQLVYMTVVGKPKGNGPATVHEAAQILEYDNPEPVLRYALAFIEATMDSLRLKSERKAREDEGKFTIYDQTPVHHAPSEEHIQECPNVQCRARRAA